MNDDTKMMVREVFSAALRAVDPYGAVHEYLPRLHAIAGNYSRHFLIGFGKASAAMARALVDNDVFANDEGIVVTKYDHAGGISRLEKVDVLEAGHPIPDENGLQATRRIMEAAGRQGESLLTVCLVSGGGSSLLVAPQKGITLADKQAVTSLLLSAGADINELNAVRKHISAIKGGRLAEIAYPSRIVSLILSDVIGNRLDVIASGPTAPDDSSFDDALSVMRKYGVYDRAPAAVVKLLEAGAAGEISETPKRKSPVFAGVDNIIIGSNRIALEAAKEKAEQFGLEAKISTSELTGEARDVGRIMARSAREMRRSLSGPQGICLISGGETTVTVQGAGKGGRNTELALAFALEIEGEEGITLLSAGTDGNDGPTDAAGADVDGKTMQKAREKNLDPLAYLDNNDSYTFFQKTGNLLITGPTGTNVMDIQIIVIEPPADI